jgi:hypothetical protein
VGAMRSWSSWSRALAVAVVIGYGVFIWWLIREVRQSEVYWSRLVFLFQGVEALVFAATGLVFGTSISRSHVTDAREAERQAQEKADEAQTDAKVGSAIVAALRAYAGDTGSTDVPPVGSDRIGSSPGGWRPDASSARSGFASYLLRLAEEVRRGESRPSEMGDGS